jgi:hypothetical protein
MKPLPVPRSTAIPLVLLAGLTPACFSVIAPAPMAVQVGPGPMAIQDTQRAAFARSMGYPTQKPPEALEQAIARATHDFQTAGDPIEGRLEAPSPLTVSGTKGSCYVVVMRLGSGAVWGRGADAGLRFQFTTPTHPGFGGPGLIGPGAVASLGCAEADGPITLSMSPLVGQDPIGQGPFTMQVWTHQLTATEAVNLEADKQRQAGDAARFKEEQERAVAKKCAQCSARYEGCIGAGRPNPKCRSDFTMCATLSGGSCPAP